MKIASTVVMAALTVVLCASTIQPATAAPPTGEWLPGVADSATLTTPAVISGKFNTADGAAFPRGAAVELVAYPAAEVVDAMVVGDSIQVTPVAKGFVGADGQFTLRLPRGTDVTRFQSAVGNVDLEVRAFNGDHYAAYSWSPSGGDLQALADGRTAPAAVADVSVAALPAHAAVRALEAAQSGPINKTDVCGETLVTALGNKPVVVGGTYTGGAGRTGSFTYTTGSNSELGVGYSVSGAYGSFSASGTMARSSSSTVPFSAGTGGRAYTTYFSYGKYSQWCYPIYNPAAKSVYAYKVHTSGYAGGGTVASAAIPAVSSSNCVPLGNGQGFSRSTSSASTFSTGASLSSSIGVNLSSKTGYTTTAQVTFSNTSGSTRNLCGTAGLPGGTPGRIVLQ